MTLSRRRLCGDAAAFLALGATSLRAAEPALDPMPSLPTQPTPGRPGDFDFLTGEWRIDHWQRTASGAWRTNTGGATVHAILGGAGSVEDLRVPERDFRGMGLRLLDMEKRVWSDFWVDARSGVLATPGQTGSFEAGVGIFFSREEEDGKPVIYAGVWDRIADGRCRWRQGSSIDGGRSWQQTWIMDWKRVG